MFHYINSITNTRGDALIGYFVQLVDTGTGDVIDIYADDNGTPIVSESGIVNMAEVDSDGNVSFFVESGSYHINIYATDGTTFLKQIENVPMITPGDFLTEGDLADEAGAELVGTPTGTVQDVLDDHASSIAALETNDTAIEASIAALEAAPFGYTSGGQVTQLTSKSTAVTINELCGQITTHNQSIASGAFAGFQVANSTVAETDVVTLSPKTGNATAGTYNIWAEGVTNGTFIVIIKNVSGGALAEALTLNFAIIKAANS